MGREWNWSTRPLVRGECEESSSSSSHGCMSGMLHYLHFHHLLFNGSGSSRAPPASSSSSLPTSQQLKGLEAPRNSLELDEGKASSTASAIEEEFYDVPVGIEIAPRPASLSKSKKEMTMFFEEERRSSLQAETPRTPGVVARLMGLDVSAEQASSPTLRTPPLTEQHAPRSRVRGKKKSVGGDQCARRESSSPRQPLRSLNNCNLAASPQVRMVDGGSRSLPETPRVSSDRYCDVVPRFSLQLNKENTNKAMQELSHLRRVAGDYSLPPSPSAYTATTRSAGKKDFGRYHDDNKSPRSHHYAREIVEQVKESINSRRGGGGGGRDGRDEIKSKSKRTRPTEKKLSMADTPSPCSPPPIRLLVIENNKAEDGIEKPSTLPPKPLQAADKLSSCKTSVGARDHGEAKAAKMVLNKCKKADNERFTERMRKQTQSPTTNRPPDSRLLPTLASLFQSADMLPEKNLPDKNKRSSTPSILESRVKEASQPVSPSSPLIGVVGALEQSNNQIKNRQGWTLKYNDPEFRYIKSIFGRAGIAGIHTLRWYSPSLPIDPIIFHQLELELPFFPMEEGERRKCFEEGDEEKSRLLLGPLRYRWNRKLLFHLVEEVLGDLLLGCSKLPSSSSATIPTITNTATRLLRHESCRTCDGEALLRQIWVQIESFPEADCRVMGDIDALIAGDLPEANVRRLLRHPSVVEEADDVVLEVEQEILDVLVGETAAFLALSFSSSQGSDGDHRNL